MSTNKNFTIHHTIEDMDLQRYRHAASMNPVQGLRETIELILRAYSTTRDDLKKRTRHNRITFTKSE